MKTLVGLFICSTVLGALVACAAPTPDAPLVITVVATRQLRVAETRAAKSVATVAAAVSTVAPTTSPASTVTVAPVAAGAGAQVRRPRAHALHQRRHVAMRAVQFREEITLLLLCQPDLIAVQC